MSSGESIQKLSSVSSRLNCAPLSGFSFITAALSWRWLYLNGVALFLHCDRLLSPPDSSLGESSSRNFRARPYLSSWANDRDIRRKFCSRRKEDTSLSCIQHLRSRSCDTRSLKHFEASPSNISRSSADCSCDSSTLADPVQLRTPYSGLLSVYSLGPLECPRPPRS